MLSQTHAAANRVFVEMPAVLRRRTLWGLTLLGVGFAGLSLGVDPTPLSLGFAGVGLGLIGASGLIALTRRAQGWLDRRDRHVMMRLFQNSDEACLITSAYSDEILWKNRTAAEQLRLSGGQRDDLLRDVSADPACLGDRLQDRARVTGRAEHLLQTRTETFAFKVEYLGANKFFWRIAQTPREDVLATLPLGLARVDHEGQITYLSPALGSLFEEPPQRVEDLGVALPQMGKALGVRLGARKQAFSVLRLADPGPQPAAASTGETLIFLAQNVDARPASDAEPTHAELEALPVAIAHLATDGQITYLNSEARALLRLQDERYPQLVDLLEGLGRPVKEWLTEIVDGRLDKSTEVMRLNRHGSETYLRVTLRTPENGLDGTVQAVLSDATEYKSLEAKFTQSQKMQAVGQLAGGVAHDFNNLLTAISGHCDLILLRHDRTDPDYPDLMQIQQNTNRAAALVRQLLALSRQQALQFTTIDLHETICDVTHLLNRLLGEKVTLTLDHGERVAPIRSDKRQFEQVLMNLVVNARDSMPLGGEIKIATATQQFTDGLKREQASLPPGTYSVIRISDTGVGIPAENLRKIFDPFFTTKRQGEGTGLGLSTVYGIIKQSGGYIFVDSEEGVGTTFTLYFVAQKEMRARDAAQPSPAPVKPMAIKKALVLLVEDEAPVRSFAARALELQGHRVIEADCGEAALEILSDPNVKPDLFVSDVVMPGIDGPGWVSKMRERFPDTPVVFMSGYAEDRRVAAQERIGHAVFLAKPFSLAEFVAIVNSQLQGKRKAA